MVEIIAFLFPLLVYFCTRVIREFEMFSTDVFSTIKKMDTIQFAHRKKYYFGFIHTNNFRPPKKGEWFQSENELLPIECCVDWEFDDSNYTKRCRWVLEKNSKQIVRPFVEVFHNLPHLKEKKILSALKTEEDTVRISRQWLRAMLTNGKPMMKLEPLIEGMTISLFKNLVANGYKVLIDEPVVGVKARAFWNEVIKRSNAISQDSYGLSSIDESLKADDLKPQEFQYGGATICNYGLDSYSYNWSVGCDLKKYVVIVFENTIIRNDGWYACNSSKEVIEKINFSVVDEFVKRWVVELSNHNHICFVTTLPEHLANEAYKLLKDNEVPFRYILSRRKKEIKDSNAEVMSRIITEIPSYKIQCVIDSITNNFTWDCMHNKTNNLKVYKI